MLGLLARMNYRALHRVLIISFMSKHRINVKNRFELAALSASHFSDLISLLDRARSLQTYDNNVSFKQTTYRKNDYLHRLEIFDS